MSRKRAKDQKGNQVPILKKGIGDRINTAARAVGTRKQAASAGRISDDMLYRYIREETMIPLDVAYGICLASGKTLGWMATGEEIEANRVCEEGATYNVAPAVYDKLLDDVYKAVFELESVLQENGLTIDEPDSRAKLVAMCVDYLKNRPADATEPVSAQILRFIKFGT
jgi:hypothetical protein